MHKRASFWRILCDGYRPSGRINKGLLVYSIAVLIVLTVLTFRARDSFTYVGLLLIGAWATWLWKSIKKAYLHYEEQYGKRLQYYKQERQYLRYLIFRDEVLKDGRSHGVSIADALSHIDTDLETEVTDVLATSIFITTGISVVITLFGSVAGKLEKPYIVLTLFLSVLALLLGATILGSLRSRKVRLLELKRYLLWLQREEALTTKDRL